MEWRNVEGQRSPRISRRPPAGMEVQHGEIRTGDNKKLTVIISPLTSRQINKLLTPSGTDVRINSGEYVHQALYR